MTDSNQLSEGSTEEQLIVTRVSEEDEVYKVENRSHEDPSDHTYQVFLTEGEPVHCECPSWEYHEGECKHMRAVEDKLEARQHWKDWQVVQKQKEERERKQAMREAKERSEQEQAVLESARDLLEEWESLSEEVKETKEGMVTKDEWRSMSSDGRAKTVAFLN